MNGMEKKPLNLILLGDPASGKATQAARLIKKYHLYDFDMGAELRKPVARKRFEYDRTAGKGHLTPTVYVRAILRRVIAAMPDQRGILFNGHPKMIGEAQLVARELARHKRIDPFFIYLQLPASEVARRAKKRKVYFHGKLVERSDDSAQALKNRQTYYRKQVSQVITFFGTRYPFKKISGMGSRAEVWKRIDSAVRAHVAHVKRASSK